LSMAIGTLTKANTTIIREWVLSTGSNTLYNSRAANMKISWVIRLPAMPDLKSSSFDMMLPAVAAASPCTIRAEGTYIILNIPDTIQRGYNILKIVTAFFCDMSTGFSILFLLNCFYEFDQTGNSLGIGIILSV